MDDKIKTLYWTAHTDGTQDDTQSYVDFVESTKELIAQAVKEAEVAARIDEWEGINAFRQDECDGIKTSRGPYPSLQATGRERIAALKREQPVTAHVESYSIGKPQVPSEIDVEGE